MPFTANPYDNTGTLDTSGYGVGLASDNTMSAGELALTDEPPSTGADQSVRKINSCWTDASLQVHSDARVLKGQIFAGHPY